jgi:hypothetical protein
VISEKREYSKRCVNRTPVQNKENKFAKNSHLKLFLAMVFFSENKKILSAKMLWEKISGPERFKKKN